MKNFSFLFFGLSFFLLTIFNSHLNSIVAQTEIYDALFYKQITNFQEEYSIVSMKMSADGTKIIFGTGGGFVKVFTINVDGSGLLQIYDFQTTGTGPSVDINGDGSKVIWCWYGNLFIANSDGTNRTQLVPLLPHPNPVFADFAPDIPLPPRITLDGSQIYFTNRHHDPLASGIWRVNADGSNIQHLLDYMDVAENVFGTDGSEYNPSPAFSDGFDISEDGSKLIFGTTTIKISEGDITRGHAIVFDGSDFYNLGEYATGIQPFCISPEGDQFIIFRRELDSSEQNDVINIYFDFLGTGDPIKVIENLDQFGVSAKTQMSSNGSTGIVIGGNGKLPITMVDRVTSSRLDLVSMDGVSRAIGNFNFSESLYPSINANGDRFCFLSNSNPRQIWMCSIGSSGTNGEPEISEIFFEPNYVLKNVQSQSHFKAHVSSPPDTINVVTAETFIKGAYQFRGIDSDVYPFFPRLVDDGTLGDNNTGDKYFNNNTIYNVVDVPIGEYSIRIAAANSTLKEITAVDAGPFFILDEEPNLVLNNGIVIQDFQLHQNYPNPFNPNTKIEYTIPKRSFVELKVFNILGEEIEKIVSKIHKPDNYVVNFNAEHLSSGIYFYGIFTEYFSDFKKMILIK